MLAAPHDFELTDDETTLPMPDSPRPQRRSSTPLAPVIISLLSPSPSPAVSIQRGPVVNSKRKREDRDEKWLDEVKALKLLHARSRAALVAAAAQMEEAMARVEEVETRLNELIENN